MPVLTKCNNVMINLYASIQQVDCFLANKWIFFWLYILVYFTFQTFDQVSIELSAIQYFDTFFKIK